MKAQELAAMTILKKHDNQILLKYKEQVSLDIQSAHDQYDHMHKKLTKFTDEQDQMIIRIKQKYGD